MLCCVGGITLGADDSQSGKAAKEFVELRDRFLPPGVIGQDFIWDDRNNYWLFQIKDALG